jgi:membrane associated rhomboid family serine protease
MAKKIRKRRTSPMQIFVLLLIPWVIMGAVAYGLYVAGAEDYVAIIAGLAASLLVTMIIRQRMPKRTNG